MFRRLLAAAGFVMLVVPRRVIEVSSQAALENPDECRLKSWVLPVARLEGVLYLVVGLRSDEGYDAFTKFLGVIGAVALVSPSALVRIGARIAYENPEECEWRSWVYPLTRLVGVGYVLVALSSVRRSRTTET